MGLNIKQKLSIVSTIASAALPKISMNKKLIKYKFNEEIDKSINVNNLDNFILQGICEIEDYVFITAYNQDKNINSKVLIYDKNYNYYKEVSLYNNAHVGGISYDEKHKVVWITDKKGTISGYKYKDFISSKEQVSPIYKMVDLGDGLINIYGNKAIAYITYFDNKLYVGNFNKEKKSFLKVINIKDDGSLDLDKIKTIKFLSLVQGITFMKYKKGTYLCVSSSVAKIIRSNIKVLKYNNNIDDLRKCKYLEIKMPKMIEQIHINKEGKLLSVYEINAKKYNKRSSNKSDIIITNISELINDYLI